ncbi:MAG: hypothetical protein WC860_09555 [Candidatus Margulisiibacteriota bacterium]|jgi:hypothetical protein
MKIKKMRIFLTFLGFLFLLYILFKIFSFLFITDEKIIYLKPKDLFFEYTKISIQPLPLKNESPFNFLITIQSNQDPDMIDLDIKATALLETNNATYEPKSWVILKREKYKIQGKLIFNEKFKNQKKIKLIIFDGDQFSLSWPLK